MSTGLFVLTLAHVVISLASIATGFVVASGILASRRLDGWTAVFLATTVAACVTGFMFPFVRFLPSHAVGLVSLLVLPVAAYARYARGMRGLWRGPYVVTALLALYLNVFVLVAQAFTGVPPLRALAPTQSEPPFAAAQVVVLGAFVALAIAALQRFRTPGPAPAPAAAVPPVHVA